MQAPVATTAAPAAAAAAAPAASSSNSKVWIMVPVEHGCLSITEHILIVVIDSLQKRTGFLKLVIIAED